MQIKPTRSDVRFFLSLMVVHAVYFFVATQYKCIYNGDSLEYINMALNFNRGWFYSGSYFQPLDPMYFTLRPPGYPAFLWLVYQFGINNWIVLFIQNLISVFNILYLRNTLRMLGYTRKYDWLLLAFVILYPSQFINANLIQPELLLQTCVLIYFRHFIKLIHSSSWKDVLIMSLALVGGMMMKPVWYPFAFLHFALVMVMVGRRRQGALRQILGALLPVLVVVGYSYWNGKRTGKVHFSSIQSINALLYNQDYYIRAKYGDDSARSFYETELAKSMAITNFADRYDYQSSKAIEMLGADIVPYSIFHFRKSLMMLIDPGKGEIDLFTAQTNLQQIYSPSTRPFAEVLAKDGWSGVKTYISTNPSSPIAILILLFNIIRTVGLLLFFYLKNIPLRYKWVVATLLCYFVFITGPVAYARYLMPVSLIIMGCAALAFQQVLSSSFKSRVDIN